MTRPWAAVSNMIPYRSVNPKEPGEAAQGKTEKKQLSVRLDWTVYDGVFCDFKREYGFTDLSAAEILILYALPRRYEAVEEFTRERRRVGASEGRTSEEEPGA